MRDDGSNGDAVAGDGIYSARMPGRAAGSQVAFTVTASDRDPSPASSVFPAPLVFPAASVQEALVRWGETKPFGNLGVYRLWQRQRDYDSLRNREPLANDPLDCTFVYGDERVVYNAEMRAKGSPWHGGSVGGDYVFSMPEDDRVLGARDIAVVTLGNLGSDPSAQREQAAFWIGRQMGIATLHRRHVHFFENGGFKGLYEDTEEPNGLYVDRWFPDGQDGDLFKIEDWFEFNDAGNSFVFARDATLERFTTLGGGLKQARYRWAWRKRAVARSANDYRAFLQLVDTVANASANTAPRIEGFVDIENWMRTFALQHIVGNWDAYGHSRGKNSYLYLPTGGRWKIIPWDIDFVLGSSSDGPTADVFGSVDPVVSRLWNVPPFRRAYWRAFQDAVDGPLAPENIDRLLDARYAALVANGFTVENPSAIKTFVRQRREYLASRVASEDTSALVITNNNGADFSTATPFVTLAGRAPIDLATLLVNGVRYPVTWTSVTGWTLSIALG
ncbi:MAG: CotH kinase family protein, partial [Verrucomicrobiales bacterium]|nr:CotH kinase family protein [Verrucomicrobiales bacterium]